MGRYRRSVFMAVVAASTAMAMVAGPATAAAPPGTRVEMKILVITDGGPSTSAIAAELKSEGVPYRVVDLTDTGRPTIDASFLADTVSDNGTVIDRALYQAVVMPGASPFANPDELAALTAYQQRFDIPQVNAYVWPDGAVGLQPPTYSGPLDGVTATLTPAGLATFSYLKGPVPFEDNAAGVSETWGFLAQPLPADPVTGAVSTPLLTATAPDGTAGNTLVAEYRANNRRQLSLSFSYNDAQQQYRLLAPGIVNWMTGGVHLGLSRNFLSVQVDDVFLPDSRWSVSANCTPGEDCPTGVTTTDIRMRSSDAAYAAMWQMSRGFTLDMVFNANGSVEAANESSTGRDALTDAMVALRSQFRWTNHTWSHEYLGCIRDNTVIPWVCQTDANGDPEWTTEAKINSEIADNITWANQKKVPIDPSELVTGEHSGLFILPQQPETNPHLAPALTGNAIKWLAADNSRMPDQISVGSALTVPRYPMNIYFNVAKRSEQVDEYNWIYTSRADGGSGICEDNPATVTCITPLSTTNGYQNYIVPLETRFALSRMLNNDPRPHYVHQANITEDRILYPLMDGILNRYKSLLATNTPVINPRLSAAGTELRRQTEWRDAIADGNVSGYIQDKQVHISAPASVSVPLTAVTGTLLGTTLFGTSYAGLRSAWTTPAADGTVDVVLP